jgi:hypothetical protein
MEDLQGSRTSQAPAPLIIEGSVLNHIKDRAREVFRDDPGGGPDHMYRVLLTALRDYMLSKGHAPGFEVKL